MGYENVILIVIVIGIILFGSKRIPELARSLGRARHEYEKAKYESIRERHENLKTSNEEIENNINERRSRLEQAASKVGISNIDSLSDEELGDMIINSIKSNTKDQQR
jgi:sec-independent protein translocase protein TatA